MASTYKTPGVYIKEIPSFPPSIAAVETAIPAFIGYTEKAELPDGTKVKDIPIRIESYNEYQAAFGGPKNQGDIVIQFTYTTRLQLDASGQPEFVSEETKEPKLELDSIIPTKVHIGEVKAATSDDPASVEEKDGSAYRMAHALQLYFANGGGPCYIVSVGSYSNDIAFTALKGGLEPLLKIDEVTLLLFPDADGLIGDDLENADYYNLYAKAIDQCEKLQDRFTIIDVSKKFKADPANAVNTPADAMRNTLSHERLDYSAAYYPYLKTILDYKYDDSSITLFTTAEISDTQADLKTQIEGFHNKKYDALSDDDKKAFITNKFKAEVGALISRFPVEMPPSSAMAGIYAKTDNTRGVWKAPANVGVAYVKELSEKISHDEQASLNVHHTGKSINAIRFFTGQGNIVWGARTLDGNSNEWRYLSVRRFFNMAEESIKKGTEQFVFEPNDRNTWSKVQGAIENFLLLQWRAGALAGATPEDAFFVRVGLNETMTALDILEGRMIVEIGMAVVRPAEFIILRFSHKMQES